MDWSLASLVILLAILLFVVYFSQGWAGIKSGSMHGGKMLWDVLPRIFLGIWLAGTFMQVIPPETLSSWLGREAGFRGVLIGSIAGILTPGGPFLYYPLMAALLKAGASAGAISAYLTAWSLMNLSRTLVWEVPFLGVPFTVARIVTSLFAPLLIGHLTNLLFYRWVS